MGRPFISTKSELFYIGRRYCLRGSPQTMVNGQDIFRVIGGPIKILDLYSECVTANDGTLTTLQYQCDPDVGAAATISGASASLASVAAGAAVILAATGLTTAPVVAAVGIGLGAAVPGIIVPAGIIELVVGVGSTTGTWIHRLSYLPLADGSDVIAL